MKITKKFFAFFVCINFFNATYGAIARFYETSLQKAAHTCDLESFRKVWEQEQNHAQADSCTLTPLHWAVFANNVPVAQFLLEAGALVDAGQEETPLAAACEKGFQEMVELLLKYNADVTKRDGEGNAPVVYAFRSDKTHILKLLGINFDNKKFDETQAHLLLTSWACLSEEKIKAIIEVYPDLINKADNEEQTPSHYAALRESKRAMKIFNKLGADQTLRDKWGKTAAERLEHGPESLELSEESD